MQRLTAPSLVVNTESSSRSGSSSSSRSSSPPYGADTAVRRTPISETQDLAHVGAQFMDAEEDFPDELGL